MVDVTLVAEHLPDSLALARAIGWSDSAADWRILYAYARVFGVRGPDGALIAQGLVSPFGDVAAIGKMIVRADARRRGLGRRLMQRTLDAAAAGGARAVTLVATDEGRPLYRAHGFVDVGGVQVLTRAAAGASPPSPARPAGAADVAAMLAFDREIMGCDRAPMLRARLAEAEVAFVVDGRDALAGFTLGVPQGSTRLVGPLLARDPATALALVAAAGAGAAAVRIDVPSARADFAAALQSFGFVAQQQRTEMSLGGHPLPFLRPERFALAAQAYA
jgi:GNAT superfamily N-acetyltransferase